MYLVFDTETGGLSTGCSLLTASFIIADDNFISMRQLDLRLKWNPYKITPQAMAINRIDLAEHDKIAWSPEECNNALYRFLHTRGGRLEKLTPVAKNITFDLGFIWSQLMQEYEWRRHVSHHSIDLETVVKILHMSHKLDARIESLGDLRTLYGITVGDYHTAAGDTMTTLALMHYWKHNVFSVR